MHRLALYIGATPRALILSVIFSGVFIPRRPRSSKFFVVYIRSLTVGSKTKKLWGRAKDGVCANVRQTFVPCGRICISHKDDHTFRILIKYVVPWFVVHPEMKIQHNLHTWFFSVQTSLSAIRKYCNVDPRLKKTGNIQQVPDRFLHSWRLWENPDRAVRQEISHSTVCSWQHVSVDPKPLVDFDPGPTRSRIRR